MAARDEPMDGAAAPGGTSTRRQGNNLGRDCNRDMSMPRRRRTSNMERSITIRTRDGCRCQLHGWRCARPAPLLLRSAPTGLTCKPLARSHRPPSRSRSHGASGRLSVTFVDNGWRSATWNLTNVEGHRSESCRRVALHSDTVPWAHRTGSWLAKRTFQDIVDVSSSC